MTVAFCGAVRTGAAISQDAPAREELSVSDDTTTRPFQIAISQADVDDLQERLARTRWLDAAEEQEFVRELRDSQTAG